jgi:uncharacterized membrane protein YhaH (DUF805 family)
MNYFLAALKKYADFKGRARRKEYWYFYLFIIIIVVGLVLLDPLLGSSGIGGLFVAVFELAMFIPLLAAGVRRMHDVDKSGWYLLIPIYSLVLLFTNGTPGPNQYGFDPKRPGMLDEIDQIGTAATRL